METEQDSAVDELPGVEDTQPASAGERLRAAREAKRLELSHIAAETRIPIRHLEAIETGSFDSLPSRTYAIGFARTYARVIGLDDTEITNAVREELSDDYGRASAMAGGMEPGDPAKLPSAGLAWFGGIAALVLVIGLIAFFSNYFSAGTQLPSLIAEEEAPAEAPEQQAAAEAASESAPVASGQVVFTALEDGVWMRVYEDGGDRLFEAQMASGDKYELPTDAVEPRINTGRPDAIGITIGGREVPKLSEEPVTMGDTPVSAAALLARADAPAAEVSNN